MALSWNEIKDRAVTFSKDWEDTYNEEAEAKSFIEAFFNVFGITRKRVGTFEHRVKKLSEADGYIDLLWKGNILIEMKSKGKNLDKAFVQAKEYIHGLKEHELPKYILVSDFENFRLFDTEEGTTHEFKLNDLVKNVQHFGFIAGYQKRIYKEQDPVNIKAADLMGKLHDSLEEIGYEGHPLEVYLVRILFCLFAEDTTIFEKQQFQNYLEDRTNEDGSDLASKLHELFQVLNTPRDKRYKNIDEQLNGFQYVNGKLFEETLPSASFDAKMRTSLLDCCYIDWSKISPAIFGSMFQSVMNPKERRNLGAHYTSEKNILKLIRPLFLDDLWSEFESLKLSKGKLIDFHKRISQMKFLDPACGCGNFLIIAYRELRVLEIDIIKQLLKLEGFRPEVAREARMSVSHLIRCDVDNFYGIEYEEFPAQIAQVAMWLMDHQMNMLISNEFGEYFVRLPLNKAANIIHANALQTDWETVVSKYSLSFIIGNPPFIGKSNQSVEQKEDLEEIFKGIKGAGVMDYVAAWYLKAAQILQNTKAKAAFVSTNSISQGEQVGILWKLLFNVYQIKIHFAHRTFSWSNEARANAAVHVVIIGFANHDIPNKRIFEYDHIKGEPHQIKVKNINPYLLEGKDIYLTGRPLPINDVPKMIYGSKPVDDGNFFFTDKQKHQFLIEEPKASRFLKRILSSHEYLNGFNRWCLWLEDINPVELKDLPLVRSRLENIRLFRSSSTKESVKRQALTPTLFSEIRQPTDNYIIIPRHSTEIRKYIPFGFFSSDVIVSDSCIALPNAKLYHFGVITSKMHNSWIKYTCGRIKSDYRYSNVLVYNNYPWPESPSEKQISTLELAAQKVLDVRMKYQEDKVIGSIRSSPPTKEQFESPEWDGEEREIIQKGASLADLYDPILMPPDLVKAHNELDKAVDLAYRSQPFTSEAKRMEFLFELYEKYTAGLFAKEKQKKLKFINTV